MTVRGFILHPTYRVESGRPVVHLFGRLETGESFLVRDRSLTPHFFVRSGDAERARSLGAAHQHPTDLLTMIGGPVVRVEVQVPAETPPLRDALIGAGLPVYEADVRFAMRRLIDARIRGSLSIEGAATAPEEAGAARVFEDADLAPSDWEPSPGLFRIVSIDLETDPRGERIYSAALSGGGADEVLLALPEPAVARSLEGTSWTDGRVVPCGDEKGLLTALFSRLRELDFDILTGWNVIDFDLDVLVAAARRLGVPFEVGRLPGSVRVIRDRSFWGRSQAEISGRLVLDGIDLLKGAFVKLEDYRLDTAARALLGEGKVAIDSDPPPGEAAGAPGVPSAAGSAKAEAIQRAFRENLPLFIRYNLADARLVLRILEKARLIDLAIRRSLLTGMPLDRVGASIASFDFLYLGELRRRKRVAPSVGAEGGQTEPTQGGAVLEPLPGSTRMSSPSTSRASIRA